MKSGIAEMASRYLHPNVGITNIDITTTKHVPIAQNNCKQKRTCLNTNIRYVSKTKLQNIEFQSRSWWLGAKSINMAASK